MDKVGVIHLCSSYQDVSSVERQAGEVPAVVEFVASMVHFLLMVGVSVSEVQVVTCLQEIVSVEKCVTVVVLGIEQASPVEIKIHVQYMSIKTLRFVL